MKKKNPRQSLFDQIFTSANLGKLINTLNAVFPNREEVREIVREELDGKIKFLPTKDDFYTRMDALSKEIKEAREELAAHSVSHDRLTEKDEELETRVVALEKKTALRPLSS